MAQDLSLAQPLRGLQILAALAKKTLDSGRSISLCTAGPHPSDAGYNSTCCTAPEIDPDRSVTL